jgi:ABC-type lipoprotein export system ATPase subunit
MTMPGRRLAGGVAARPRPGEITLVSGPSGAGKTLLLRAMVKRWPDARLVEACPFPLDVAVIDAVAPTRGIDEVMSLLTACGLGEPALWLRRFDQLSEGERFRARLARAISLHQRTCTAAPLLCDEFSSNLHPRMAQAIAFNLRKLATREKLTLVLATCRQDIATDLRPDRRIEMAEGELWAADGEKLSNERSAVPSFADGYTIELTDLRDYARFAPMHYRRRESLGFIDKVFALRTRTGEALAVVVYGRPGLELRARNEATGGRFVGDPQRLNAELRVLKRLVVHPDARGCGLGHRLVRATLPLVGVRLVECLAALGAVNPVFVKAGMQHIGVCALPSGQERLLSRLAKLGADPLSTDFAEAVRDRPDVQALVRRAVIDWYRGITGGGKKRVEHQSPRTLAQTYRQIVGSRPVYYLWAADKEAWAHINGSSSYHEGGAGTSGCPRPPHA